MKQITQADLKENLNYDPKAGVFTWKKTGKGRRVNGTAGHRRKKGYMQIWIYGKLYYTHRLAWLYVYGEWPKHRIDHINGNTQDNRIQNLRDVPQAVNAKNARKWGHNTSGYTGIDWDKKSGRWRARIAIGQGEQKHLGYFKNIQDAIAARKQAEEHHGYTGRHGGERVAG